MDENLSTIKDKLESAIIALEEIAAFTTDHTIRKMALDAINDIEDDVDQEYWGP